MLWSSQSRRRNWNVASEDYAIISYAIKEKILQRKTDLTISLSFLIPNVLLKNMDVHVIRSLNDTRMKVEWLAVLQLFRP